MKIQKQISKFLSSIFLRKKMKAMKHIEVDYDKTKFREIAKTVLGHTETKSANTDYQSSIRILYSNLKINLATKSENDSQTKQKEAEVLEKAEKENEKIFSNFFNDYSLKILENSNKENLIDLACKSFVGNTDIPKDYDRSISILTLARAKVNLTNKKNIKEKELDEDIIFFNDYFKIIASMDANAKQAAQKSIIDSKNMIKSKYIFARDLFKTLFFQIKFSNYFNNGEIYVSNSQKEELMANCYYTFKEAAEEGIYEANYFLGLMALNGCYSQVNKTMAYYYFSLAASYSHSLSFYEIYKMIKHNDINIYNNEDQQKLKKAVVFDYLKSAAEEGYLEAMYELGNEYMKGELCKKNYELAYAWHRQACRNGYILSYEPCGDLLYYGANNFKAHKSLAFIMYFTGYRMGLKDMEKKMLQVREELIKEGEPLADIINANVSI